MCVLMKEVKDLIVQAVAQQHLIEKWTHPSTLESENSTLGQP